MIVFFIVLIILFLISLIFLMLCLSDLEIEINKLYFDTHNKKHEKLKDYLFYIRLKLFDKITWVKIKIDNKKVNKIKKSKVLNSKIFDKFKTSYNVKDIILKNKKDIFSMNIIKELDIEIKQLDLEIELSIVDAILTSLSVPVISSIISIILSKNINKYNRNKYHYKITPLYEYKPALKIKLNCIINIKIVHIMNIIYILTKKRSVEYDKRTSNRRAYVCSNE